jgi:hypothetical protein
MHHVTVSSSLVGLMAAGLLAGCPDRSISEVDPQQGRVETKDIPVKINRDLDLLFLIDDSPSMGDKQDNLAHNFSDFITALSTIPGGLPNVHIGVVTSDLGTKGASDAMPGPSILSRKGSCAGLGKRGNLQLSGAQVNGPYLSDIQSPDPAASRIQNYRDSDKLADVFQQMAHVGATGCGFEQHLEAIKQALDPGNTANAGFLRPDAYLAVIIVADEDDCSMAHSSLLGNDDGTLGSKQSFRCTRFGVVCDENGATPAAMNQVGPKARCHPNDNSEYLAKVSDYVEFLKGLKSDPRKVIVAGIMGTPEPFATELRKPDDSSAALPALAHACSYVGADGLTEVADPPIRLKFFLDQFPNRSTFASICQRDLSGGLQQIAELLKAVIGDPCIEGKLADLDPETPGPQYSCSVSAVTTTGQATPEEKILPACTPDNASATNQPCWHLATDPRKCVASDHLLLTIEGQDSLSQDTHILANCVTEPAN